LSIGIPTELFGYSIIAVQTPQFEIHQDDVVEIMGDRFKVVDLRPLQHENVLELIVKG